MRLTDRQRTATEKEGLTLTPSAFLFSRLLAAVEGKKQEHQQTEHITLRRDIRDGLRSLEDAQKAVDVFSSNRRTCRQSERGKKTGDCVGGAGACVAGVISRSAQVDEFSQEDRTQKPC